MNLVERDAISYIDIEKLCLCKTCKTLMGREKFPSDSFPLEKGASMRFDYITPASPTLKEIIERLLFPQNSRGMTVLPPPPQA